jgi:junctophilin
MLLQGLKLKKQRSTGDLDRKGVISIRSTGSTTSWMSSESGYTGGASIVSEGSNQSFVMEVR